MTGLFETEVEFEVVEPGHAWIHAFLGELGGQAGMLLTAFKAAAWTPLTTAMATEGMLKAGLKTSTKPERIAAFYLCQWVKKGLLNRHQS